MSEQPQNVPDSGTLELKRGSRVYIPKLQVVGTVIEIDVSDCLVRYISNNTQNTEWIDKLDLVEQLTLPFEDEPFNV